MSTMKAVLINDYGDNSQLTPAEVPLPTPGEGEVLVRNYAAGINPVDWKVREGYLKDMLNHPLPLIPGWDLAGEVAAVGDKVARWHEGDAVYARPDIARQGTYAEYTVVRASELGPKPQSLDWVQAAGVPLAALTAWQALYDQAELEAGQKVLIHAGAGGVGHFAIQLAKLRGAQVYTTCSTHNVEFVKSLGADEVIDYRKADFSRLRDLDVVFDTLGGAVLERSWQCLKPGGRLVSIVDTPDEEKAKAHQVDARFWFVQPSGEQLTHLAELFDHGKLRVEIDNTFPLDQAAEALTRSESGRARGKIVLKIL